MFSLWIWLLNGHPEKEGPTSRHRKEVISKVNGGRERQRGKRGEKEKELI